MPGRELTRPPEMKGLNSVGLRPDGFTAAGNPIELKSEYKVMGKAARKQLSRSIMAARADFGEMWVWRRNGDEFTFEPVYRLHPDGSQELITEQHV
jgi:hypothetical protein